MPLYTYECQCGNRFTKLIRLVDYQTDQRCTCGEMAKKVITVPAIFSDYAGYECPVSGSWIEGKKQHEENLKKHNCRILEKGEMSDFKRNNEEKEKDLTKKMTETVMREIEAMPTRQRERLLNEIDS